MTRLVPPPTSAPAPPVVNLPNLVTVLRLGLAVLLFFLLLPITRPPGSLPSWTAPILFVVAVASDVLDGWLARRLGHVTAFGRVADPFVDKVIICGALIFFSVSDPFGRMFPAWLVSIVVAREFLVNGLRSLLESRGYAFGANVAGKAKMVVQSVTVGAVLFRAAAPSAPAWTDQALRVLAWATLAITVLSTFPYVTAALRIWRREARR
jgi:CDP-diacylglycerol--glycerol-3-phosphate 3-phosphatidyltransferase